MMEVSLLIICALVARSYSAPEKWGGGFETGVGGSTDLSLEARLLADAKGIAGGLSSSAAGDLDAHVNGGLYRVADGKAIGVNGGLNKKIGGSVDAGAAGSLGWDSGLTVGTNLVTDTYAKVGGHANIASGDEELRQIAAYEGKMSEKNKNVYSTGTGSLLSYILPDNFWLYVGLFVGGIVLVTMCCVFTLCGCYYILLRELRSIKTVTIDFQQQFCKAINGTKSPAKKSDVFTNEWDTNC